MILFTGSGAISECFSELYTCKIISARKLSDDELGFWIMNADIIIHNAALINANSFKEYIDGNFILTKRILDLVCKIKPSIKFINISSMSILSNNDEYLQVDEMTDYAFSKFISEKYCLNSNLNSITSVRFSTIFYANEKKDGISKLIFDCVNKNEITIYNDGNARRDILPLKALCHYLFCLSEQGINNKTINIVSGNTHSFKEVVNFLKLKNNKLLINNLCTDVKQVLSNFSKRDIEFLGYLHIDIQKEISDYYDKLYENINLQ